MRNSRIYPVALIVGLCGACSAVLTLASSQWAERIAANEDFARVRAVVDAFGLLSDGMEREEVVATYTRAVSPARVGDMSYYEVRRDGELLGYALPVAGRGRYGPIKGVLALGASKRTILALRIHEQHETPGLGGRIASSQWLGQFSGRSVAHAGTRGLVFHNWAGGPNVIRPVTCASMTMRSVSLMLNRAIAQFLAGGRALAVLDLGLRADAISMPTPEPPKVAPPHLRGLTARPPFLVPAGGTVNLARGKPVTSSTPLPATGELEQLTDGCIKSGVFDYVELGRGPQWVQVDLGDVHTVYAVAVWHGYQKAPIYNDVIVQASSDAEFGRDVRTLFNNDHDNSSGLGTGTDPAYIAWWWAELVDARGPANEGTPCRYVRVWTNQGWAGEETRFVEIRVYGRPNVE